MHHGSIYRVLGWLLYTSKKSKSFPKEPILTEQHKEPEINNVHGFTQKTFSAIVHTWPHNNNYYQAQIDEKVFCVLSLGYTATNK